MEGKMAHWKEDGSEAKIQVCVSALQSVSPLPRGVYASETPFLLSWM